MRDEDVELLADDRLPDAVRVTIAEKLLGAENEAARLKLERSKLFWNAPLAAAAAGVLTLAAKRLPFHAGSPAFRCREPGKRFVLQALS